MVFQNYVYYINYGDNITASNQNKILYITCSFNFYSKQGSICKPKVIIKLRYYVLISAYTNFIL